MDRKKYLAGWRNRNRKKLRAANRAFYRRHLPKFRLKWARQKAEKRAIIAAIKNKPCMDCGREFPSECMDFDHVRGNKLFTVSDLTNQWHSIRVLKRELVKCELVCACCHRIRTKRRMKKNRSKIRRTWGCLRPVTKVKPSARLYVRKTRHEQKHETQS